MADESRTPLSPSLQAPSWWLARSPRADALPDGGAALGLGATRLSDADVERATSAAAPMVDVAVIGGGLCGTVLAWQLRDAGLSVALIEARRIGEQGAALGSGAVSALWAPGWRRLAEEFGADRIVPHAQAHQAAVETVAQLCERLDLDCGFERVAAHAWMQRIEGVADLRGEYDTLHHLGLAPEWVEPVTGLPFPAAGALRLAGQARIDPLRFARGLAARFVERGGLVLEGTRVHDVEENGARALLRTDRGAIVASHAVLATGLPFVRKGNWFAEAYPRTQVLTAFRLGPQAALPEGLWATADEPQRTVHVLAGVDGGPVAIASGRPYKSGEVDARAPRLEIDGWLRDAVPGTGEALGSWTAEWWDSMDGLPFVGHLTRDAKRLWVATGLGPQASTAVVAASVLADRLAERDSPWARAYDATRVNTGISARRFLAENFDVAKRWIHDHMASPAVTEAAGLAPGEAALVAGEAGKIACYRDPSGTLHAVDATCTHLGCTVHWNAVSTCWDCPCHGSRFAIDGQVLHGPATRALAAPRWKATDQAAAGAARPDAYRRAVDPEAALFDTPDAANMRPGFVPEATPAELLPQAPDRMDAYRRAVDPEAALFDTPDAANMRPGVVPEAAPAAAVGKKDRDKPSAE